MNSLPFASNLVLDPFSPLLQPASMSCILSFAFQSPFATLVVSSLLPRYSAPGISFIHRYIQMFHIFVMVCKTFLSISFISHASNDLPVVFKELLAKCFQKSDQSPEILSLSARGRVYRRPAGAVVLWLCHRGSRNRSSRVYCRLPTSRRQGCNTNRLIKAHYRLNRGGPIRRVFLPMIGWPDARRLDSD
jgi:hypothetical protein